MRFPSLYSPWLGRSAKTLFLRCSTSPSFSTEMETNMIISYQQKYNTNLKWTKTKRAWPRRTRVWTTMRAWGGGQQASHPPCIQKVGSCVTSLPSQSPPPIIINTTPAAHTHLLARASVYLRLLPASFAFVTKESRKVRELGNTFGDSHNIIEKNWLTSFILRASVHIRWFPLIACPCLHPSPLVTRAHLCVHCERESDVIPRSAHSIVMVVGCWCWLWLMADDWWWVDNEQMEGWLEAQTPTDENAEAVGKILNGIFWPFSEVSSIGHIWYKLYGILHQPSRCPPHVCITLPEVPIKNLICSTCSYRIVRSARERVCYHRARVWNNIT